jgi:hypothetical protein
VVISFCDTTTAKNLAGQPSFDPTKLATYAAFINAMVEGMLGGLEFAPTDAGNNHADFVDGGENFIKTRFSPVVTLTKIEYVDSSFAVVTLLDATWYINRDGTGIIEARYCNLPPNVQGWPGKFTLGQANIKITYLSGYGPSSTEFKQASLGATNLLASMILQDVASTQDATLGGVQSWTIETVSKAYGSNGSFGASITRFWAMGQKLIDDLAGKSSYQMI